jgi:hypothetical protein
VASASYIGSRVMHLYNNVAINYAKIVPGPLVTSGCAATALNCNSTANTDARRLLSLLNPLNPPYLLLLRKDLRRFSPGRSLFFSLLAHLLLLA